ncbi:MAG: SiaB family protein kinase [Crocinitomicaceae bacterium]|nr:SiaB family protein kinase [Crocinitomicaceae bacterium]
MIIFGYQSTMELKEVYNFYRKMEGENVILSFKGEFTSDLLTSILDIMESKMRKLTISDKLKKRVFNILVECFQNLYHHIEHANDNKEDTLFQKSALIMVKYVGDKIIVQTGNYVKNNGISDLENRLSTVNDLTQIELRKLYQDRLLNNSLSDKGTAGLGLIDIARKSKNKLGYEFIPIDKDCSFFCLNVIIE